MSLKSHKDTLLKKNKVKKKKKKKDAFVSPLKDYVYTKSSKKKVVAYIRVSTKKEGQLTSIKNNQPVLFRRLFREKDIKENYELLAYYPESYSGTKIIRPVFQVLLQDAGLDITKQEFQTYPNPLQPKKTLTSLKLELRIVRARKFDEIWVKSTSRFARNIDIKSVLDMLKANKVIVRFLDIDMSTDTDDSIDIYSKILSDMRYSEKLSKDIAASRAFGHEEKRLVGTGKEFGYDYHKSSAYKEGSYTINEDEAEIVRFIYNTYLNGFEGKEYGMHKLSKLLAEDLPNKRVMLTRKGKPFGKSTIQRMLKNPMYKGYRAFGKYTHDGSVFDLDRKVITTDAKPEKVDGIPVLIEEDVWEAVQQKIKKRTVKRDGKIEPVNRSKKKYTKQLVCGRCGNNFRFDNNRGNSFYICASKKSKGYDYCQVNNVYSKDLDNFIDNLAESDYNELFKVDIETKLNTILNFIQKALFNFKLTDTKNEHDTLNDMIKLTETKLDALLDTDDINNIDFLSDSISRLKKDLQYYNKELETLNTPIIEKFNTLDSLFVSIDSIINYYEDMTSVYTKEDILEKLDKIMVYGVRPLDVNLPHTPILVPLFKSSDDFVDELLDSFDIPLSNEVIVESGIEYFDTIDEFINDKELNTLLKEYLSEFDSIEDAKEYAENDKQIPANLLTYIMYFDTLEEALSDDKISPFSKKLLAKDFIYATKRNKSYSELPFNLSDLDFMYGENVKMLNEYGEEVVDTGYMFDFGVAGDTPISIIKDKLTTLKQAYNSIKTDYEREV